MSVDRAFPPGSEVLLLEDDATLRRRLAAHLARLGASVAEAGTLAEARRLAADVRLDFALIDLHLPDGEALELLREGVFSENTGVVVMTAFGSITKAVEAMRLGAGDYLAKPIEPEALPLAFLRCRTTRRTDRREEHLAAERTREAEGFVFGPSLAPLQAQLTAILAADRRLGHGLPPVLIEGETGTGKSALARWLHRHGPRAAAPFLAVNCAALPEALAEAELFGHERGAFTDAKRARLGLFEAADGGTLFLDEVASLAPATQAKLLTAIEDGRIRRLGATRELAVDARVIAASNRPLADLVRAGAFREDLFHRLNLLQLTLPPLRARGTDVIALAHHLVGQLARRYRRPGLQLTTTGEARLLAHPWRGNVRELAHELERAAIFSPDDCLDLAALGPAPLAGPAAISADTDASLASDAADPSATPAPTSWRHPAWRLPEDGFVLEEAVDAFVTEALRETGGNVSAAARRLGVTREFLRYRLRAGAAASIVGEPATRASADQTEEPTT